MRAIAAITVFFLLPLPSAALAVTVAPDMPVNERTIIAETLPVLPKECEEHMQSLTVTDAPRFAGFVSTSGDLSLSGNLDDDAFRATLIHECGHILDFFAFTGTPARGASLFRTGKIVTFLDDPSLSFYRISWTAEHAEHSDARPADFVSRYAETEAIEDFAETFAYYILQHDAFKMRALQNSAIRKKWEWMQRAFPDTVPVAIGTPWDGIVPDAATAVHYEWRV